MNSPKTKTIASLVLVGAALSMMACAVDPQDEDVDIRREELVEDCSVGDIAQCMTETGFDGVSECFENDFGVGEWTECTSGVGSTPLVLSFDNAAVSYRSDMRGSFDLTGAGMTVATDWPTAATPWLALDRDGDGHITSGAELFGSATTLADGTMASHGFMALAELDDNHDGVISAADAGVFSRLLVWADSDGSRSSDGSELTTLAQHGIVSIALDYRFTRRCDTRNNCEKETARFVYRSAGGAEQHGSVVDIHLAHR